MASPPAKQVSENSDARLSYKKIDAVVTITKTIVQYSFLAFCVYYIYRSIAVLAGKATFASLGLSVLGNIQVSDGIYIVLTGGSIIYGLGQRELRRRNIKRLTERPIEMEKRLDPNRSSSGLTTRGTTRPEDKT